MTERTQLPGHPPEKRVHVRQEHIDNGVADDSGYCMVAEALKDHLRKQRVRFGWVAADVATIRYSDLDRDLQYQYITPHSAAKALVMFESGIEVEPFSFRIRAGLVFPRGRGHKNRTPKTKEAAKAHGKAPTIKRKSKRERGTVVGGRPVPHVRPDGDLSVTPPSRRRTFGVRAVDL